MNFGFLALASRRLIGWEYTRVAFVAHGLWGMYMYIYVLVLIGC